MTTASQTTPPQPAAQPPAPPTPTKPRWRRALVVVVLLAGGIAATRWVYARHVSSWDLHMTDELEMTLSSLDRFLGVPPTSLNWPGTFQQMVYVPIIAADYAVQSRLHPSPIGFIEWLGEQYRDPRRAMLYMRGLVVVISSLGLALLAVAVARRTGHVVAGALCAALLATNLVVWQHSNWAMADAVALGLLATTAAILLRAELTRGWAAWAGLVFGLALASKMTTIFALPLLVVLLCVRHTRRPTSLLLFLLLAGVGFVVGCPYALLDPLRIAKSVLGNVGKPGAALGVLGALHMIWFDALGWPLALAAVGALLTCIVHKKWALLIGTLLCLLLAVAGTMRSAVIFPRYYACLVPAVVLCLTLGLWHHEQTAPTPRRAGWWRRLGVPAVLGLLAVWQTVAAVQDLNQPADEVDGQVVADLAALPAGTRVIVPHELDELLRKHADSAALRRLANTCEAGMLEGRSFQSFVAARAPALVPIGALLVNLLNEEEQAFIARERVSAGVQPRAGLDLWLTAKPDVAARFSLLRRDDAIGRWRTGQADVLVLHEPLEGEPPTKTYASGQQIVHWRYDRPAGATTAPSSATAATRP